MGEDSKRKTPPVMPDRDSLELAMWAAWLGVNIDQIPPGMKAHTCADTLARWARVGRAAIVWHQEQAEGIPHHPLCSTHKAGACDFDCARDYRPLRNLLQEQVKP